jgi:hypothetical protein
MRSFSCLYGLGIGPRQQSFWLGRPPVIASASRYGSHGDLAACISRGAFVENLLAAPEVARTIVMELLRQGVGEVRTEGATDCGYQGEGSVG